MKELYPWQTELWQRLNGLRSRLPHALLLKGAAGIGKLDLAMDYAQAILCESPLENGMACHQCPSCHWFAQESHPDFRLVQPEVLNESEDAEKESGKKASSEISVAQIRALANFATLSSHAGGYRVILIHPAEAMNANSANALLKTLEEPTDKLLFLLISHKPQQLLPTILSRCLSIAVPMPEVEQSSSWLKQQGIADPANLLAQTGFAPLLALQWAEEDEDVETRKVLLDAVKSGKFDALALAEKLQKSAPVQVVHCLQQWCYDLLSIKQAGKVRYFPQYLNSIENIARSLPLPALLKFLKDLQLARREATHPLNARLQFESLLLGYQQAFKN